LGQRLQRGHGCEIGIETAHVGVSSQQRQSEVVAQIGHQVVGLLVEGVSDIFTVTDDKIQPTPDVASEMAKKFVRGVIAMDGRMISLIALDSVLPAAELQAA
jgi:purine-binding chemotaxis protein CheW